MKGGFRRALCGLVLVPALAALAACATAPTQTTSTFPAQTECTEINNINIEPSKLVVDEVKNTTHYLRIPEREFLAIGKEIDFHYGNIRGEIDYSTNDGYVITLKNNDKRLRIEEDIYGKISYIDSNCGIISSRPAENLFKKADSILKAYESALEKKGYKLTP